MSPSRWTCAARRRCRWCRNSCETLRREGVAMRSLFLDSTTDTLVRRYSETRRRTRSRAAKSRTDPPEQQRVLIEAIDLERELLADLRDRRHVIDTSIIRPAQLQSYVKALISASAEPLTLVFESFAFKRGMPLDADYVFDVRMLPNPHYVPTLRPLTGRDQPVIDFLREHEDVAQMYGDIEQFLARWLDAAGPRPPQLCDRGHRLHRRPAPVGVPGGAARARLRRALGGTQAAPARTATGTEREQQLAHRRGQPERLPAVAARTNCPVRRTTARHQATCTGCRCRSLWVSTCRKAGASCTVLRSAACRVASKASRLSNTGRQYRPAQMPARAASRATPDPRDRRPGASRATVSCGAACASSPG
jgi:hypothetical protein